MRAPYKNDQSVSIELEDEDLLDIDGSDDPTTAFAAKKLLRMIRPAQNKRSAFARGVVEDPTIVIREDVRETLPIPMRLAVGPGATARPAKAVKSPTISPVPSVRKRNADSSYPPMAVSLGAHRERAMSFISERPSRAGWIAAAVIGALILVGGSLKVGTPKHQAAAEPPPAAAAEPTPAPEQGEPKVVTFGDSQGVSIKPKADAKPEAKKPAAHAVFVAPKAPAAKPTAKLPDGSLSLSKDTSKDEKVPATSHDAPATKAEKAEQKKLKSIEQELADAQLKAAAR